MTKGDKKNVMLVDDNEIDIFINKKVIEFSGYASEIIVCQTASEALDLLDSNEHQSLPDIIFLDLNMPVIDGFKFLFSYAQLHENIKNEMKVVVLTSSDNLRDKEKIAANPDVYDFISKPLTDKKVEELFKSF